MYSKDYILQLLPAWAKQSVLLGYRGSDAHGTKLGEDNPASVDDIDIFSISIQPKDYYLTLDGYNKKNTHFATDGEHLDILVYDIFKWADLATKGNPNCLSWLWNRSEDYMYITVAGALLIGSRNLFLSREIFARLAGYALGQLRKIEASRNAGKKYFGYMGEKRKSLVDKFGYDTKNAAHCIRLLRMSQELARNGTLYSYRPEEDRKIIKEIKQGLWSYEEVKKEIETEYVAAKALEKGSTLPEKVDRKKIDSLLASVFKLYD